MIAKVLSRRKKKFTAKTPKTASTQTSRLNKAISQYKQKANTISSYTPLPCGPLIPPYMERH